MRKKVPMRMCVGCREMKPKRELIRIVRSGGTVRLDESGRADGRGAYVCASRACLERAVKTHALERAFSCKIDEEMFAELAASVERACGSPQSEVKTDE